jgi:hypothetical protein
MGEQDDQRIEDALADHEGITRAIGRAAMVACCQHKIADKPVVAMRKGKMVWVPPDEIVVPEPHCGSSVVQLMCLQQLGLMQILKLCGTGCARHVLTLVAGLLLT